MYVRAMHMCVVAHEDRQVYVKGRDHVRCHSSSEVYLIS